MHHEAPNDISLRHLRVFTAILETGRLSSASKLLRRSPSTISRSLSIVETAFATQLLDRTQTQFSANQAGQQVAIRCQLIQSELNACRELLARSHRAELRHEAALFSMQTDVAHLRALIAVHDFRSVQRAAHYLSISQPAVSYSIRFLESDTGVTLFSRTPEGMIPTPAGVNLTVTARRLLSEISKMFDDVHSIEGISTGRVCVGGLAYSRAGLLPEAIEHVLKQHPKIHVRTVEGPIEALLSSLHGGEIDMVICAYPDRSYLDGIAVEPIASDSMGLFVSCHHPLAQQRKLTFEDFLEQAFILPPSGSITRKLLEDFFLEGAGKRPHGRVETSSYSVVRNLLLESDHIAFRSLREFSMRHSDERIVALDTAFELPVRRICLLQRKGVRLTAAVRDFLNIVRKVATAGEDLPLVART